MTTKEAFTDMLEQFSNKEIDERTGTDNLGKRVRHGFGKGIVSEAKQAEILEKMDYKIKTRLTWKK